MLNLFCFIIGTFFGIFIISLCQVSKNSEIENNESQNAHKQGVSEVDFANEMPDLCGRRFLVNFDRN